MSDSATTARGPAAPGGPVLRPLERADVPALTRLVRENRTFLSGSGPLRTEEHFTDQGQERAVLTSLEAAAADASAGLGEK